MKIALFWVMTSRNVWILTCISSVPAVLLQGIRKQRPIFIAFPSEGLVTSYQDHGRPWSSVIVARASNLKLQDAWICVFPAFRVFVRKRVMTSVSDVWTALCTAHMVLSLYRCGRGKLKQLAGNLYSFSDRLEKSFGQWRNMRACFEDFIIVFSYFLSFFIPVSFSFIRAGIAQSV
jgi:hypothetical protein